MEAKFVVQSESVPQASAEEISPELKDQVGGSDSKRCRLPNYMPLVIVTEILAHLPVKNLLQLRCVCRDWCRLITHDSHLKELHFERSKARREIGICVLDQTKNYPNDPLFCIMDRPWPLQKAQTAKPKVKRVLQFPLQIGWVDLQICRGLWLVISKATRFQAAIIVNPATRETVHLPSHPPGRPKLLSRFGLGCTNRGVFKVVAATTRPNDSGTDFYVFNPSNDINAPWRTVNQFPDAWNHRGWNVFKKTTKHGPSNVCVNNTLYCPIFKSGDDLMLMRIDLELEQLRSPIGLPAAYNIWNQIDFFDLDGRLAIVGATYSPNRCSKYLQVWVWEEEEDAIDGVAPGKWIKIHKTARFNLALVEQFLYIGDGNIVMFNLLYESFRFNIWDKASSPVRKVTARPAFNGEDDGMNMQWVQRSGSYVRDYFKTPMWKVACPQFFVYRESLF